MCDCNHDEMRSITRLQNRALRTVNRNLRRTAEKLQQQTDETVAALFDAPVDNEAELAFRELWEHGRFQPPIGPQDYNLIVKRCLNIIRDNERRSSLDAPSTSL